MRVGATSLRSEALRENGIGLVETLLALGIATIIVTSMVSLSIFTVRSSLQNKLALEGTQLANQEIEQIRAFRDARAWPDFVAEVDGTNSTNCFNNDCHMSSGLVVLGEEVLGAGTPQELHKSFRLTDQSSGENSLVRVAVTVNWRLGAETKYSNSYTELADWKVQ